MNEEDIAKGYCITCPRCGAVQQRGYETDSTLICGKCHHEFYAFMEGGFQMEFPAYWTDDDALLNRMKAFVVGLGLGHGRITYKPIQEPACVKEKAVPYSLQEGDAEIVQTIRRITEKGNNAEVKRNGDGSLKVFEVKKNIAMKTTI